MRKLIARTLIAAATAAMLAGEFIAPASADQAFICEDASVIMVPQKDLERMKRTNPCIASHYGLSVETTPELIAIITPPLPERPTVPKSATTPSDTTVIAKPAPDKRMPGAKITTGSTQRRRSNYREVTIINARPGAPRIFFHTR